jgi:hypothetical protein
MEPPTHPSAGPIHHNLLVLAGEFPDASVAELTGLLVGQVLGNTYAERDQARAIVDHLANQLAETLTHMEKVVTYAEGTAPGFAHDADMVAAARVWLAQVKVPHAVGSPETPEQETT